MAYTFDALTKLLECHRRPPYFICFPATTTTHYTRESYRAVHIVAGVYHIYVDTKYEQVIFASVKSGFHYRS